jgi:predicted SAM-dependent methyltransferase
MKKTYTVYGNCQGQALSKTLKLHEKFMEQYEYIQIKPVQNIKIDELKTIGEKILSKVDLLIYQPVSNKYKNTNVFASDNILSYLKKNCIYISFPSCYFGGYFPELITIKDENGNNISVEHRVNDKVLQSTFVHDANILLGFIKGYNYQKIILDYKNTEFYDKNFLGQFYQKAIENLKLREGKDSIDIAISSYIEKKFRKKRLFHTFNHPTYELIEYIAKSILEKIEIPVSTNKAVITEDFLDNISFPIYSAVQKKLDLEFNVSLQPKIGKDLIKIENFIENYLNKYKEIPLSLLQSNMHSYAIKMQSLNLQTHHNYMQSNSLNSHEAISKTVVFNTVNDKKDFQSLNSNFANKKSDITQHRNQVAARYLRGHGIEIGALHRPLKVPNNTKVSYVDRMSREDLQKTYLRASKHKLVEVDIIDDGETLHSLSDNSYDFLIANHMIEHCQNPIQTIKNFLRVIRVNGILFMAVPDKRHTFDRWRPVTSIDHLVRDYAEGPEWSFYKHIEEFARLVDRVPTEELKSHIQKIIDTDPNIHFHVWTLETYMEFLLCCRNLGLKFKIELIESNNSELLTVLRKTN